MTKQCTFVVCIIGLVVKNGINRMDIAGRDVTDYMQVSVIENVSVIPDRLLSHVLLLLLCVS